MEHNKFEIVKNDSNVEIRNVGKEKYIIGLEYANFSLKEFYKILDYKKDTIYNLDGSKISKPLTEIDSLYNQLFDVVDKLLDAIIKINSKKDI